MMLSEHTGALCHVEIKRTLTRSEFYTIFAYATWNLETIGFQETGNRNTRRNTDILEQRKETAKKINRARATLQWGNCSSCSSNFPNLYCLNHTYCYTICLGVLWSLITRKFYNSFFFPVFQVAIKFVSKESVREFKVVSFTLHKFGLLNGKRYLKLRWKKRGTGKPLNIFCYRTSSRGTWFVLTIIYLVQKN